jgi:hypothetical protein
LLHQTIITQSSLIAIHRHQASQRQAKIIAQPGQLKPLDLAFIHKNVALVQADF